MDEIEKAGIKKITKEKVTDTLAGPWIPEYNPVQDFCMTNIDKYTTEECKEEFRKWVECIDSNTGFEAHENSHFDPHYLHDFIERWYCGMVAQALGTEDDQIRNEWFLALVGKVQGTGKTRFMELFTLPQDFINRGLVLKHGISTDDNFKRFMKTAILIFDDELDGKVFSSGYKSFKALMSENRMPLVRKYENEITMYYRRATLAGTGNDTMIIKELQNRRFIPVKVEDVDLDKLATINRDKVWMHCWYLVQEGFEWWFNESIREQLHEISADFTVIDDVDQVIAEYIERVDADSEEVWLPAYILKQWISKNFPVGKSVHRVGHVMSNRNFGSYRKGKKRLTGYWISAKSAGLTFGDPSIGKILADKIG
jgi:predicted P-loop ATPase